MRSRPSRHVGNRTTRRNRVSGGLVGLVFAISLTLVPVALNSNLKAGGKLVVGKPVAFPSQAAAGKPFAVSFRVTRGDTGAPVLRGRMSGHPSIAGRMVQHRDAFSGGA